MAVHDGTIIYHKAFGNYKYEPSPAMGLESIFDLASVTKVSATTVSVMKLYEQGKLDLNKKTWRLPALGKRHRQSRVKDR
ncbi:MAG: serine hydrolase domain-containing protein [Bacteroidota bacterium]